MAIENKDKIAKLRKQIAALEEQKKSGACGTKCRKEIDAAIESLNAEIKKITDVGNGDGSGRKPISSKEEQGTSILTSGGKGKSRFPQ